MVVIRAADGDYARVPELAAELIALKPDVVMTNVAQGVRALTAIAPTTPIVMFVGDPVGSGLIKSLAHPGGNVTGVSVFNVELSGKRLKLLREALPRARRIAVLWNAATPQSDEALNLTEAESQRLGLKIFALGVRAPDVSPENDDDSKLE